MFSRGIERDQWYEMGERLPLNSQNFKLKFKLTSSISSPGFILPSRSAGPLGFTSMTKI